MGIGIGILCIMVALLIHEFAHAYMSYQLGDPTAKYDGRLTLNPLVHFEPIGAVCLALTYATTGGSLIMGWAKPVPINPDNFKNRTLDTALVAAAGPLINFLLAFVCSLILMSGLVTSPLLLTWVRTLIVANVGFAVFNLLPWPPLDGWKILGALVGETINGKMVELEIKLGRWSLVVLLLLVSLFGRLFLYPVNRAVMSIFLGGA